MVKIFSERRPLVYLWGFVDQHGAEVLAPEFLEATDFSEGYAFVMANEGTKLFGIIDKSGKYVHEPAFDKATAFSESLAAVRVGEKWGYVDHYGRWAIPPNLSHAELFWHGLARVAFEQGRGGYIDKSGSVVWQNKSK
jgi:WG containing repeat